MQEQISNTPMQAVPAAPPVKLWTPGFIAGVSFLLGFPAGFVLAAGDDVTDEDLFGALPSSAWSLRVGPGESRARFSVSGPSDLLEILEELRRASSLRRPGTPRARAKRHA